MGGRNIYISMLVFVCVLFPGGLLFQHSKEVVWGLEVAAFAAAFTALHVLDNRQRRREQAGD